MFDSEKSGSIFEHMLRYNLTQRHPAALQMDIDKVHRTILDDLRKEANWKFIHIQSFFLSLRHLVEFKKLQAEVPVLNFYCNWCAHVALTQSAFGYQMLEALNNFFLKLNDEETKEGTDEKAKEEITSIFSIDRLCIEIRNLLRIYNIENLPITAHEENRESLKTLLFYYVDGKAVSFGNQYETEGTKAFKYYERINSAYKVKGLDDIFIITQFTIFHIQGVRTLEIQRKNASPIVLAGYTG